MRGDTCVTGVIGEVGLANRRRHCTERNITDVYIGRPSPFGNPFSHQGSRFQEVLLVDSRDEAVARYGQWFETGDDAEGARQGVEDLAHRVAKGEDIVLVCWCTPLPCHGDFLRRKIINRAREIYTDENTGTEVNTYV